MDDRRRTLVATAIILGAVAVVVMGIGALVSRSNIVSPVPQSSAGSPIKIIVISPTPSAAVFSTGQMRSPTLKKTQ